MDLDDRQMAQHTARTMAEQLALYNTALREAGLPKKTVHEITVDFHRFLLSPSPDAFVSGILRMMSSGEEVEDDE